MVIQFSGDQRSSPVEEWIEVDSVTEPLILKVKAYDSGDGKNISFFFFL